MVKSWVDSNSILGLRKLQCLIGESPVEFYSDTSVLDQISTDGVYTFIAEIKTQKVAIISTNFKVFGGSFSKANSKRICEFIQIANERKIPLIFNIDSLGVRFTEGRVVFDHVFSILSELAKFRKTNLFMTMGCGHILGLAALIFAQGHYRIAVRHDTEFNLTGPEVHRIFFGGSSSAFSEYSNSDYQFHSNTLIHELFESKETMFSFAAQFIGFLLNSVSSSKLFFRQKNEDYENGSLLLVSKQIDQLKALESQLGDELVELFPHKGIVQRVYIGKIDNQLFGYLVNPPGHAFNLLTAKAVEKATAAMELFQVLRLPVVSILDSPGGDPRKNESDQDSIVKMIRLVHLMIDYPFPKIGIVNGRCFGGAGLFNFPKIYGGIKNFAVSGSKMGVMSSEIINALLKNGRLRQEWEKVSKTENSDMSDMLACGTIDEVIELNEIRQSILKTFSENSLNQNLKEMNI